LTGLGRQQIHSSAIGLSQTIPNTRENNHPIHKKARLNACQVHPPTHNANRNCAHRRQEERLTHTHANKSRKLARSKREYTHTGQNNCWGRQYTLQHQRAADDRDYIDEKPERRRDEFDRRMRLIDSQQ